MGNVNRWMLGICLGLAFACGHGPVPPARGKSMVQASVPVEARRVLAYVRAHHEPPPDYAGGRRFGNYERALPQTDANGARITYQEWDVHPHRDHVNRGAERIVTGSDGRAWYTGDHYQHFTEMELSP